MKVKQTHLWDVLRYIFSNDYRCRGFLCLLRNWGGGLGDLDMVLRNLLGSLGRLNCLRLSDGFSFRLGDQLLHRHRGWLARNLNLDRRLGKRFDLLDIRVCRRLLSRLEGAGPLGTGRIRRNPRSGLWRFLRLDIMKG